MLAMQRRGEAGEVADGAQGADISTPGWTPSSVAAGPGNRLALADYSRVMILEPGEPDVVWGGQAEDGIVTQGASPSRRMAPSELPEPRTIDCGS